MEQAVERAEQAVDHLAGAVVVGVLVVQAHRLILSHSPLQSLRARFIPVLLARVEQVGLVLLDQTMPDLVTLAQPLLLLVLALV